MGYIHSLIAAGTVFVVVGMMMTSISTKYYEVYRVVPSSERQICISDYRSSWHKVYASDWDRDVYSSRASP